MDRRQRRIGVTVGVLVVAVAVFLVVRGPSPPANFQDTGLLHDFTQCLPAELDASQREEVLGLLDRFYRQASAGFVDTADQRTVTEKLQGYIEEGTIARKELEHFMAEVSFYTNRNDPGQNPPDGSGVHPLLQDDNADTTRMD